MKLAVSKTFVTAGFMVPVRVHEPRHAIRAYSRGQFSQLNYLRMSAIPSPLNLFLPLDFHCLLPSFKITTFTTSPINTTFSFLLLLLLNHHHHHHNFIVSLHHKHHVSSSIRELKQRRRRRQLERQKKSNRFIVAKQKLRTCITLFCTFLCHHCTTTT